VALNEIWSIGRSVHASIAIPEQAFTNDLFALWPRLEKAVANDVAAHAADVYLVAGCLLGIPAAFEVLDREYLTQVPKFLAHIDRRPDFVQEVTQRLRERLLSPATRKLADYVASGSLGAWLRVAARRLAIDAQRRAGLEARHLDVGASTLELAAGAADPEREILRERYSEPLERAIQHAVASLSARERMVLRLYLFGGENIEKIGKAYRVHRATVARWIVAAQDKIIAAVRADLGARFGISEAECDSLTRALRSRLNLSLAGVL
jgi:RNA polymerase sigma-70 factor (ECF subfamily)